MLTRLGGSARVWARTIPWSNVYGAARTILALGTAGTLAFSQPHALFRDAAGVPALPCAGYSKIGLFCVLRDHLGLARWLAVAALLVVASGWRPKLTGAPHWWISFSLFSSATLTDGGDQVTSILTLLLIPVTLSDPRRWHWASLDRRLVRVSDWTVVGALSCLIIVRLQFVGLYAHAATAKFGVEEWANGTAMYYWLIDPSFRAWDWLLAVVRNPIGVTVLTWGTLLLELALAIGLLLPHRVRKPLLACGIVFHAGIAVVMGLVSFSLAMIAGLMLYLWPWDEPFRIRFLEARFEKRTRSRVLEGSPLVEEYGPDQLTNAPSENFLVASGVAALDGQDRAVPQES